MNSLILGSEVVEASAEIHVERVNLFLKEASFVLQLSKCRAQSVQLLPVSTIIHKYLPQEQGMTSRYSFTREYHYVISNTSSGLNLSSL